MSAEFSELVESTVCVAQPAPRWQQVTGEWSASKIPDTFIPAQSSYIFVFPIAFSVLLRRLNMSALTGDLISFFIVCPADLGLHTEVQELVNECEQPGLTQSLPLPEDLALRHLPALNLAHRRLDFTHRYPSLSSLQEVHTSTQTHTLGFKWVQRIISGVSGF